MEHIPPQDQSVIVAAVNKVIERTNENTTALRSLDTLFSESLTCRSWRTFKRRVRLGQKLPPVKLIPLLDSPPICRSILRSVEGTESEENDVSGVA